MIPKPTAVLLAACLVVAAGCNEEEFFRYPSLSVPEFTPDDYIRDLSNHNPEVVYNAVCNLGSGARDFGRALGGEKADPTSKEYRTAQTVYRKLRPLLQARDPQVVAASLRFLQLFSEDYKPKAELIDPISHIQSAHPQVQFEQVAALSALVTNTTRLPAQLLRRLLASPSWIVSRNTYQLIDQLADETLRQELVRRYRSTADETERLLLLTAFRREPAPVEIELLKQETLTAASPKIRHAAGGLLVANLATAGILPWIADHYPQFRPEDRTLLFDACAGWDAESAADLVCRFLAQGHVPNDDFLQKLNKRLEEEPGSRPSYLVRVEQAVQAAPALAGRWQMLREKTEQARARFAALQREYAPLSREFIEKTQALLTRYDVPAAKQQPFLEPISNLKQIEDR